MKREKKNKPRFKYKIWDFDCDGEAYVIAKRECTDRKGVPKWIVENDNLPPDVMNPDLGEHLSVESVSEGWCKYQVRTDWDNCDGEPTGGYFVHEGAGKPSMSIYSKHHENPEKRGKPKPGWFPVWIVRLGDWY